MATVSTLNRSNSNSRTLLICNDSREAAKGGGETSRRQEMEGLSFSKSLVRSMSEKFKKKRNVFGRGHSGESSRASSSTCLGLYVKGGGCRVVACDDFDSSIKRRLSSMDECMPQRTTNGVQGSSVECFSYGVSEKFWRRSSRKEKGSVQCQPSSTSVSPTSLPDDVLEMILARLPLSSIMIARCVCKKWRYLTSTPHFIQMRAEGSHATPWLFLFGITRGGCHAGDIHALDVSHDRWHRISNDALRGRFLFSVASIKSNIYIVGGCSSSSLTMDKCSIKIHKGVLVFNPLSCSWHKAAPMRLARSGPILGVVEVSPGCSLFKAQSKLHDRLPLKSRIGVASDVYEDPHRLSLRLRLRDAFLEEDETSDNRRRSSNFIKGTMSKQSKFALIAVGGRGPWDEPLESAEIYDSVTDRWTEIASLPGEFGAICSGTVCGQTFYVYSETDKLAGYDIERGFWTIIQVSRPPPRLREYYPKLIACRSRLFLSCVSWCERDGQLNRREKAVRKLWEMDSSLHTWNEVSRHPDAPMDRNAMFVADESMVYTIEMFRIFGQVLDFLTACHVSETGLKWRRISKKHVAQEVDASSCSTKSMLVLHL
ncbi:F-box/kelch-repeat protein [Canna indica]|uniref:F-box/kelch-repeat protein n=1 Tax=Canna indica TaxID=4628 RepID=A0AAQ3JNB2_9LILI|nr:F-box/kelch-repeat protein [Canna indica]